MRFGLCVMCVYVWCQGKQCFGKGVLRDTTRFVSYGTVWPKLFHSRHSKNAVCRGFTIFSRTKNAIELELINQYDIKLSNNNNNNETDRFAIRIGE